MKKKPLRLTKTERRVLEKVTEQTQMNDWFSLSEDSQGCDCVLDSVLHKKLSLRSGIKQLNDVIVPRLVHLTESEYKAYHILCEKLDLRDPFFIETTAIF